MHDRIRPLVPAAILFAALPTIPACIIFSERNGAGQPLAPGIISEEDGAELPNNNDLCLICLLDFAYDSIAEEHLAAGITCGHCHGLSTEHMTDETMMTSPDVLHGRTEVSSMCTGCHLRPHETVSESITVFLEKWENKKRENGRSITPESVCTDCHGLHTIARR